MYQKGKWTYEVDKTKSILKSSEIVTKEGEIIELDDTSAENIAMNIVNYKEAEEERKLKAKDYYTKKESFENKLIELYGKFHFNFYRSLPKISKQYLFRFIYMCTYLKYNDTRMMIKDDNGRYRFIYENELQDLLKLGRAEYFNTKKELTNNNLIYIDGDKIIHINNKLAINGNVGATKRDYIRIFNEAIRDIYENSLPKEHKRLYIFIELLPYINYNLNVLCFNPKETTPELIKPLTLEDITNILGIYKGNNKCKLQNLLLNTFVNGNKVMMINKDYKKEFYVVNPCIYYKGNRMEDITYLISMFKM